MAAHQAPPSLGFSRQEHWSGLPFPSPMHKSEKWKWSRSVMSDSLRPHGLWPSRLLCPWDFPGKSTGVGCHCLLRSSLLPNPYSTCSFCPAPTHPSIPSFPVNKYCLSFLIYPVGFFCIFAQMSIYTHTHIRQRFLKQDTESINHKRKKLFYIKIKNVYSSEDTT